MLHTVTKNGVIYNYSYNRKKKELYIKSTICQIRRDGSICSIRETSVRLKFKSHSFMMAWSAVRNAYPDTDLLQTVAQAINLIEFRPFNDFIIMYAYHKTFVPFGQYVLPLFYPFSEPPKVKVHEQNIYQKFDFCNYLYHVKNAEFVYLPDWVKERFE